MEDALPCSQKSAIDACSESDDSRTQHQVLFL